MSAQLGNYLHETRLVGGLLGLNSVEMPIAFSENIKGNEFTIGITDISLTTDGAKANILAGLKLAKFDGPNWVMFTGRDVCLHPAGFGGQHLHWVQILSSTTKLKIQICLRSQ
ncbi:MAG: hypothetical protein IPL23_10615 [Saprospiraceae bacterium]|nr:hypothetical protein [Saprospiraceae bacterium]